MPETELDKMLNAAGAPATTVAAGDQPVNIVTDAEGNDKKRPAAATPTVGKPDRYIVAIYVLLCLISVVELYSASSRELSSGNVFGPLLRHMMMLGMGIAICVAVSRVKIKYFVVLTPVFVCLSVIMMVYVLLNGQIINGARRSFSLVGIQIQPAELLKISAVMIIAYVMSRNQTKKGVRTSALIWSAAWVVLFSGLLFSQGLTNTLLLMGISGAMMIISGVEMRKLLIVFGIYVAAGGCALGYKMSHGDENATIVAETGKDASGNAATLQRGATWNNRLKRYSSDIPLYEQRITAENRQEMYAHMAQANGGLVGVFPGNSRETARLPLAFSDYIYSIVVEDLGFIGGVFLLLIYLSLLGRAAVIALRCDRAFPAMMVMGMAVMIVLQALFHMAIVTGVFPVSGQPLPMISKGGTSMLVTSLAFGIMLSISRYASTPRSKAKAAGTSELPTNNDAVNLLQLNK